MSWTEFMDMSPGGGRKEGFAKLWIEAPEDEARVIFYNRFGHNPDRVSCTCCGEDYSISEYGTLEEATAYERNLVFISEIGSPRDGRYLEPGEGAPEGWETSKYFHPSSEPLTLADFLESGTVNSIGRVEAFLIIRADDIAESESVGDVPAEGYVWMGS